MNSKNSIVIRKNGPLVLQGELRLQNGDGELLTHAKELFLCRCGSSKNKPYCDGTHKQVLFEDEGFIHDTNNDKTIAEDGALVITVRPNGPLIFNGPVSIHSGDETQCVMRKIGGLCRCGKTAKRPFCDGTHSKINFVAE